MPHFLGIDLGTTYTAAAVCRDGHPEIIRLGSRTPSIPSVVLLREDGEVLTGEAAERRAIIEPLRIAREFKRRLGDPTPITVGGEPHSPEELTAALLTAVVNKATETEGSRPDGIALAHPANWTDFKKDLLLKSAELAELGDVSLLTEPEAAAIHYASQERVARGSVVAVYDLGGGTFDAAVLRRTDFGWQILGQPEGVERLGGIDFDEAVFNHVAENLGDDFNLLDPDDPAVLSAVARLRHECVEAKEALASDTEVSVPVLLPSTQKEVRLTRTEFEQMIRPSVAGSITALERALRSAGVQADKVSTVLLVGGSSRIPLVGQMVGEALGRPVAVDAHPKHAVAMGTAIVADQRGALAALTAASHAANAAATALAGLASVPGGTGDGLLVADDEEFAPDDATIVESGNGAVAAGLGATAAAAGAVTGTEARTTPPPTGPTSTPGTGTGAGGYFGAPDDATQLGQAGPSSSVFDVYRAPGGAGPGTGQMRTGQVRTGQVRSGQYGPPSPPQGVRRQASKNAAPVLIGAVSALIIVLVMILLTQGDGTDVTLEPTTTSTSVADDEVTTTLAPGDDPETPDDESPQGTGTTLTTSTTLPSTTTSSPSGTTVPTTTAPATTAPSTTAPPTTEPPTTTTAPPTTETTLPTLPVNILGREAGPTRQGDG
jgi:actin-like ATPase involved in cell morphogenesis